MYTNENLKILNEKYVLCELKGEGTTSKVYKAYEIGKPTLPLAIKILKVNVDLKEIKKEIEILSTIKHPNVICLYEYGEGCITMSGSTSWPKIYIVFEYAEKDWCSYMIEANIVFNENQIREIMKQLLNGLSAIHTLGYAHRDIKWDNIMIDINFNFKIADLGFATLMKGKSGNYNLTTPLGTPKYMAPEIVNRQPYHGDKVDIFALGVTFFILSTRTFPIVSNNFRKDRNYKYIYNKEYDQFIQKQSSFQMSKDFWDLFFKLVAFDPKERPTIKEIYEHSFMKCTVVPICEIQEYQEKCSENFEKILKMNSIDFQEESREYQETDKVYRGEEIKETENYFTSETICKPIKMVNNIKDINGQIKVKGITPITFMNYLLKKLKEKPDVDREIKCKGDKFTFKITDCLSNHDEEYEDDFEEDKAQEYEDEDEDEDEDDRMNYVKVKVSLKSYDESKKEYILKLVKLGGDKMEVVKVKQEILNAIKN